MRLNLREIIYHEQRFLGRGVMSTKNCLGNVEQEFDKSCDDIYQEGATGRKTIINKIDITK